MTPRFGFSHGRATRFVFRLHRVPAIAAIVPFGLHRVPASLAQNPAYRGYDPRGSPYPPRTLIHAFRNKARPPIRGPGGLPAPLPTRRGRKPAGPGPSHAGRCSLLLRASLLRGLRLRAIAGTETLRTTTVVSRDKGWGKLLRVLGPAVPAADPGSVRRDALRADDLLGLLHGLGRAGLVGRRRFLRLRGLPPCALGSSNRIHAGLRGVVHYPAADRAAPCPVLVLNNVFSVYQVGDED